MRTMKLEFKCIWKHAWLLDNSNTQHDVHKIAQLHKYGGWQTWNTNIRSCGCCVVALASVI